MASVAARANASTGSNAVGFISSSSEGDLILTQIPRAAADRERLAGDVLAGIAGEEQRHVRDVLRGHGRMHAHAFQQPPAHLFLVEAETLRFGLDDALDAVAFDHARLDAVD